MTRLRNLVVYAGIICGATVLAFLLVKLVAPLNNLETRLADLRVAAMQRPQPISSDVAIVAIDEPTVATLPYRSPIDRAFLAELIKQVAAKGARAIAVDVLIDRPTESAKDGKLAEVIRGLNVPLRFSFTSNSQIVTPEQLAYMRDFIPAEHRVDAALLTDPFDNTVRSINPGGTLVNGQRVDTPDHPAGFVRGIVAAAGYTAPREPVEIAWRARPDAENQPFPTFSALYLSAIPDELIRGRIILIGAMLSLTDRHLTPLSIVDSGDQGNMPGVMIQAHGVSQVIEGRAPPSVSLLATLGITIAAALIGSGIGLSRMGILGNVGVALAVVIVCWTGAILGYGAGFPMVPLLGPTLALALSLWLTDLLIGSRERKQRRFIQATFSRYVSPAVVDQLVANPESVRVHGAKQVASFIFTDLEGFTTLSEVLPTETLADLLNSYLDGACAIVLRHGGTVDKFIGDAIMAIFNAPLSQPDHQVRAVLCALELDTYAEGFRARSNANGIPLGVTRIGVHCGSCVVGNFGSQSRMDFTALGDTVNTAARTEGANKYFGTRLCCTNEIVAGCSTLTFYPIGDIVLKGKVQTTTLYVPVETHDAAAQQFRCDYMPAYHLLESSDAAAAEAFRQLHQRYPEQPLVRFHFDRIAAGNLTTRVVFDSK